MDRVVGAMAADGLAASTRRGYVQALKGFHRFLVARRAAEIEAAFGVRLSCPVDEFNASRHGGSDSSRELPPPTTERVDVFFEFLKGRIANPCLTCPMFLTTPEFLLSHRDQRGRNCTWHQAVGHHWNHRR